MKMKKNKRIKTKSRLIYSHFNSIICIFRESSLTPFFYHENIHSGARVITVYIIFSHYRKTNVPETKMAVRMF